MTDSTTNPNGLSDDQLDLLLAARELDDPVLIESETHDRVRELLGSVLESNHSLRDGAALPLTAQLDQLEADGNVDDVLGQQHPETGGVNPDDLAESGDASSDTSVADALRAHENPREIRKELAKADAIERNDRLPNRAAEIRAEIADDLGVDIDALTAIDRPSDPTLI